MRKNPIRAKRASERRNPEAGVPAVIEPGRVSSRLAGTLPAGYAALLEELKSRIRTAQIKASLAANRGLILLYWEIGRRILDRQSREGWGAKVIGRLARDLQSAFPEMHGFSPRNLLFMRAFAEAYPDAPIVKRVVSQIPWGHNIRILQAVKAPSERLWYMQQTIANGWSRNVLALHVRSGLYRRQGRAVTNFKRTLPAPQSDLAQEVLKDPYVFDFLSVGTQAHERAVEDALPTIEELESELSSKRHV